VVVDFKQVIPKEFPLSWIINNDNGGEEKNKIK
jgi:hypothetical protein